MWLELAFDFINDDIDGGVCIGDDKLDEYASREHSALGRPDRGRDDLQLHGP
jgi:hypothetical protein